MSDEPLTFDPARFGGTARVFPLPGMVMFPHVMQALHIFEPRYRAMLEDALSDDRLIAMATLSNAPGDDAARPALEPAACLCRIATSQRAPDGTSNILLLGVRRLTLGAERPPIRPFRVFEAEILEDIEPAVAEGAAAGLQQDLLAAFRRTLPEIPQAREQLDQLLAADLSLGMLADIVAYSLDLDVRWKLRLLAEPDVVRRTRLLVQALSQRSARKPRPFPPPFSRN